MDDFFNEGYEVAKSIVETEDSSVTFPTDDVKAGDVVRFVEGVIQLFADRLHSIKGIRSSMNFLEAIKSFEGYDAANVSYRGVKLVHATNFWPEGKIEIVAGPRVNNG
ncbi:hypothetical protein NOJ28_11165 [Neorhizobium galegae]|uniref:hypothetical protein n=1 Tax=Neorhizobium galegae TaxID=399 RepID=UPI002105034E|nr:hypothetical protein [Neorhizobium galegae]MCQ1766095.1 hypothetical protein [Neorhizobium galegae]MCQ1845009.1 hypothetical protein [Neorhizobium galegae]